MITNQLKIYTTLLFLFGQLFNFNGYSQNLNETIIVAKNDSEYNDLACNLRKNLINSVKSDDTLEVKKIRNTIITFHDYDKTTIKSKLLTTRENQMLQFYNGEHNQLLSDIELKKDFFISKSKPIDVESQSYVLPDFSCGDLTLSSFNYWESQSNIIISKIQLSFLSNPEKELLIMYWEQILLYIEANETLSPDINKKAIEYLEKYPNTKYRDFVERLSLIKKHYKLFAITGVIGFGGSHPTGTINKYLKNGNNLIFELGIPYKKWNLSLGYNVHNLYYQDSLRLERIDTINFNQSSHIQSIGHFFKAGYTLINKGRMRIRPFINADLNRLVNFIDIPDSSHIRQLGKIRPNFGFGTEGSIRLTKNPMREGYKYDNSCEEKNVDYRAIYLNIRLGYYPNLFDKPTSINGNIFYFNIGIEYCFGANLAKYSYKK